MDVSEFYNSSDLDKLDYVLNRLNYAYSLFKIIYDSGHDFPEQIIEELGFLGDEFSRIGVFTEDKNYNNIYEDLNKSILRLENIVSTVDISQGIKGYIQ